jgi:hypothetical protein
MTTMSTSKSVSLLFYVAAAYNLIFGVAFLFAAQQLFELFKTSPPEHPGYIQFMSLVMMVFAAMFFQIARKPEQNRNLIPYAVLLKLSSVCVIMWHWFVSHTIPAIWKPFAVLDLIYLIAMLWAMGALAKIMAPMKTY